MLPADIIQAQIELYLQKLSRGEEYLPDAEIDALTKHINLKFKDEARRTNDFRMRVSNLGRPLCQLQMEQKGVNRTERQETFKPVKFATGGMLEAWLVAVLKSCGLPITSLSEKVSLEINGEEIQGELDLGIDNAVYDIKTASAYSFRKYQDGFMSVYEDDPFGYVIQGFLYAAAKNQPFGGWIVVNKNTGEIVVCETPINREKYEREAILTAASRVDTLIKKKPFERQFEDIEEKFKKAITGNRKLPFTCAWCDYKFECWEKLTHHPVALSTAKDPKWEYYTHLVSVIERD